MLFCPLSASVSPLTTRGLGSPKWYIAPSKLTDASNSEAKTTSSPSMRTKLLLLSYTEKTTKFPSGDQSGMSVAGPLAAGSLPIIEPISLASGVPVSAWSTSSRTFPAVF